jgi:hypothetical protein
MPGTHCQLLDRDDAAGVGCGAKSWSRPTDRRLKPERRSNNYEEPRKLREAFQRGGKVRAISGPALLHHEAREEARGGVSAADVEVHVVVEVVRRGGERGGESTATV